MNSLQVFKLLPFLLFISTHISAQNITRLPKVEEGFEPFQAARECFPVNSGDPLCSFSIKLASTAPGNSVRYDCIRNATNGAPVLRVQGDFHRFKIQCSSHIPIDFLYYGILPNEGIFVNWWKEIDMTSPTLTSLKDRFVVEVEVYSVQALFQYYNNPENSPFEDHNDGLPYLVKHDYPRTGNYTFPGIFDPSKDVAFYFILEDGAKPEFLRNNRTIARMDESNQLHLPCISSHLDGTVELSTPFSLDTGTPSYNPLTGYTIPRKDGLNLNGNYTCILKFGGNIVDTLTLKYEDGKTFYLYGFLEVTANPYGLFLEMWKMNYGTHTSIKPKCLRISHDDNLPDNNILISVPMTNFGFMRMRQLFALPEYYNRSYTARMTNHYVPLTTDMSISTATTFRMLTVYCRYGSSVRISDIGASVTVDVSVLFAFGRDWAKFDRSSSKISTHFLIGLVKKDQPLYIGTEVSFFCKVNLPVVTTPVVWYTMRMNGSYVREFVDYDLDKEVSIFSTRITASHKEVLCYGSYWYSPWFRNISMPLALQDGSLPEIINNKTDFKFLKNTAIASIKCEATGKPRPRVTFKRNGIFVGDARFNEYILDLEHIDESKAGIYVCVATNGLSTVEKEFTVEIEYGKVSIGVIIAIPVVVFLLTILGAFVYIRFFRPEKTGLTQAEIEDFIKGIKDGEFCGNKGEYAHDFAHLVPYTGDYEISPNHFKIDPSNVLGSGAYGLVLQGMLDDKEVAVKTVKRNADKQYLKALLSELKIMIYLGNHPNIIQIMGAYTKELSKGIVYVFVKYVPHGSLEKYLRSHKSYFLGSTEYMNTIANRLDARSFGVDDLLRWATEVAAGMDYLSSRKVIHGDLAARNILLDQDMTVRITDFGLSRQLYDYSDYVKKNQEPLPWRWMALESLKYLSFSTSSDVWSFGITIWEIFSLAEVPYPGYSWNLQFIEELESGLRMSRPRYASNLIYVLMSQCWHKVPEKRPTFSVLQERLAEIMKKQSPDDASDELTSGTQI